MSRFVYAFAFLLLASTVSANHNLTLTVYPEVNDCGSTPANANATSVPLSNFNLTSPCNVYGIDNTTANNFNFTATCSSTGVLTIQMFSSGDCSNVTAIPTATFSSNAGATKCNPIPVGVIGNNNPASIFVPFCTAPATPTPTNFPNTTNPNGTTNAPTSAPTPTVPTNGTNPPPRGGVAAQQAGVSAALMAAAAAVIVMALF